MLSLCISCCNQIAIRCQFSLGVKSKKSICYMQYCPLTKTHTNKALNPGQQRSLKPHLGDTNEECNSDNNLNITLFIQDIDHIFRPHFLQYIHTWSFYFAGKRGCFPKTTEAAKQEAMAAEIRTGNKRECLQT